MKAFLAASVVIVTMVFNLISIGIMRYLSVSQPQYVGFPTEIAVDTVVGIFTVVAATILISEILPPTNTTQKRVY